MENHIVTDEDVHQCLSTLPEEGFIPAPPTNTMEDEERNPVYESDFDSLLERISMIQLEPPQPCPVCNISGEGWQCEKMYYHVNCLPCNCGKDVSKPEAFRIEIVEDGDERVHNCTCLDEIDSEV